jgi:serine/threonine-protein kinase
VIKFLSSKLTGNANRLKRFEREGISVSGLNYRNILTIQEFGPENDSRFIVTEYVKSVTLREKIADGQLSISKILDITGQIAAALEAAHVEGIVHRDFKPDNVMIRDDSFVKVPDFGIAKLVSFQENSMVDSSVSKTAPTENLLDQINLIASFALNAEGTRLAIARGSRNRNVV